MKNLIKALYLKDKELAFQVAKILDVKILNIKKDVDKLVKTYALKIFSGEQKAPMKTQQKLHNAFDKYYNLLKDKYPKNDFDSNKFWSVLKKKPMFGGVKKL